VEYCTRALSLTYRIDVWTLLVAAWIWAVFLFLAARDGVANRRAAIESARMAFMVGSVEIQAFNLRSP
jgi:hypothetical protein